MEYVAPGTTQRIIPARAGFTIVLLTILFPYTDHPRSRGVYRMVAHILPGYGGSSPLARGLLPHGNGGFPCRRIIPARAGFTGAPPKLLVGRPDHPRSRGGYHNKGKFRIAFRGSSPLARGLLFETPTHDWVTRIIPARAGFTPLRPLLISGMRDHPRSRGVYYWRAALHIMSEGSSPLARGLRTAAGVSRLVRGIIPARAGFT